MTSNLNHSTMSSIALPRSLLMLKRYTTYVFYHFFFHSYNLLCWQTGCPRPSSRLGVYFQSKWKYLVQFHLAWDCVTHLPVCLLPVNWSTTLHSRLMLLPVPVDGWHYVPSPMPGRKTILSSRARPLFDSQQPKTFWAWLTRTLVPHHLMQYVVAGGFLI